MERNTTDTSPGIGRGRPVQHADLRRPFTCPAFVQSEFVPSEGSSNGMRINSGIVGQNPQDLHIGESGMFAVQTNDQMHHPNTIQSDTNRSEPEKKFVLSPHAPEFIPRNFRPEPRTVQPMIFPHNSINSSADSYPIQELRQFLCDITLNPGKFESKIQPLVDCLNEFIDEDETMRAVVNIIFDESVRQPNFRYNGARLSKYLCDELTERSVVSSFRTLLLKRCFQEIKRRDYLMTTDDGGIYLRGFAMYLAELFSQLEVTKRKLNILAENLIAVMETLLSQPVSENVKCICQLLKLVGVYLEDSEREKSANQGTAPEIDKIFNLLKDLLKNQDLARDIRGMVTSVIELREVDWGRANENNDPVIEEHIPPSLNEPVMYGPDGQPITAEESLFLHSQYSNNVSDPDDYELYDENIFDNEMEDEMAAAYEVFLSEMSQQQQQQQQ